MVKLSILFRRPTDEAAFEQFYNHNLALLEKMPGIRRRQANLVFGNPAGNSPYYRTLEFYFEDRAALDLALRSPEGQAAGADLMQFARNAELIFSDTYED